MAKQSRSLLDEAIRLHQGGELVEAARCYQRILRTQPRNFDALHLLGVVRTQQGAHDDARILIVKALRLNSKSAEAHSNLGSVWRRLGRHDEAVAAYRRALQIKPGVATTLKSLGDSLKALKRHDEAIDAYNQALEIEPDYVDVHNNLGGALKALKRHDEAVAAYRRALQIRPDLAEAHNNLGNAFFETGRHEEAVASYRRALQIKPDFAEAHNNLGNALRTLKRLDEAIAAYRDALAYDPDHLNAVGQLAWLLRRRCDWTALATIEGQVFQRVRERGLSVDPFVFLAFDSTPEDQLRCARQFLMDRQIDGHGPTRTGPIHTHDRIRVGYLSTDFHEHPVAHLMAELFERHDRSQFEIFGLSLGPDSGDEMRRRLIGAFDRFVDLRPLGDAEAARRIADLEVDIVVDLNGYTTDNRIGILAYRPAPVQVNYLGFTGTTGAEFIDYVLVDRFVVPADQQAFFSERLIHLPECYQANDTTRKVAERTPSRAENGLPTEGVVFCCFNNTYKLNPGIYDIWMRLLDAVPGSVLWLRNDPWAAPNLCREAEARGVDRRRIVFAPRTKALSDHLARHRLADLFLDTLPFNAHTTANDALWAGLPVVTCAGHTFAGRVAGSLLHATGLHELVTNSLEAYERLALELATEPGRLQVIRATLERNRPTAPLFDGDRFRRHIEAAYMQMWNIRQRDQPPRSFAVEPSPD